MAEFRWANGGPVASTPPCYANPKLFDIADQECRQCSHYVGCRDAVASINAAAMRQQSQAQAPAPNQVQVLQPAPTQRSFWTSQVQPKPQRPTIWHQQDEPVSNVAQYHQYCRDTFGRLNDPLHMYIANCPVPPRPQMEGETFASRVGKNVLLTLLEALFGQLLLSVRQAVWPPSPKAALPKPKA